MAKQILKVTNFKGGVNSLSDARDIEDNQFVQNWNAATDKDGVIRVSGGGEYYLKNVPHDVTNLQAGHGLFSIAADVGGELIEGDFNFSFEEGAVAGYASGTPSITLASTPTYTSSTNHLAEHYYKNKCITLYKTADGAAPQGETRRITAYAEDTRVATLDSAFSASPLTDGTEYYKIFNWIGDGSTFGNSGATDYIDNGGSSSFSNDDIESYNGLNEEGYFLRTKVTSVTDELSKDLGYITYNPLNTATFSAGDTDSTTIGATTLKAGLDYTLSFYCKASSRYYGYISNAVHDGADTNEIERVPFIQLYSDSVTDGTTTGLYLFQNKGGAIFQEGADSTYGYADDLTKNYVTNGDFETGSATGGTLGYNGTYDPPTNWLAYDGFAHNTNNTITYSYIGSSQFGGDGATLNMASGSAFAWEDSYWDWTAGGTGDNAPSYVPNCFLYQEMTVSDNQWYELFFAYSTSANGMSYAIIDRGNLKNTAVYAAETESQDDGDVVLTVDNGSGAASAATDTLLKNKIICKSDGTVLGVCTAVNSNTEIRFAAGTAAEITNNDVLHTATYITPWEDLEHTGGVTTYKYIGETNTITIPKAHKFFVPVNPSTAGDDLKITIAFAPKALSTNIRLDGITVRKSFPDLLSMSNKSKSTNPYSSFMTDWNKYQFNFKIPSTFNDATDWVLNINAGSWGFQNGATGSANNQTVYIGNISLTTQTESDNLIFLNSNETSKSKIMIYSENTEKWTADDNLTFSFPKLTPVYTYINGMLKISDSNFKSGNTSKLLYYSNRKRANYLLEEKGYRVREGALSSPPPIIAAANQNSPEINETFDALKYIRDVTFKQESDGTHLKQHFGETETNWKVGFNERVTWYKPDLDGNEDDSNQFWFYGDDGSSAGVQFTNTRHANPFYMLWAGAAGGSGTATDDDMQSDIAGYNGANISKVEFTFTYSFATSYRYANNKYTRQLYHPYFEVRIGKQTGTDVFDGGAPDDAEKKAITSGDPIICSMINEAEAVFYDGDDVWEGEFDSENGYLWQSSQNWPTSELNADSGGDRRVFSEKHLKGIVTFDSNNPIAITDDMLMEFKIIYPGNSTGHDLTHSFIFGEGDAGDFDFSRNEKVYFHGISVHFEDTNWDSATDGLTPSDKEKTKVNCSFGPPSTTESAVGWSGRIFDIGVSSVNIFNEESYINKSDFSIGTDTSGNAETNESNILDGYAPDTSVYVGYGAANNDYAKELKYYFKDTESDIWYLQFYIDLEKSTIYSTTSNFSAVGINDTANKCFKYVIPRSKMLIYNEIDSYESETLIPQELAEKGSKELVCDYKAATVANNRLYVGNIRQNGVIYPDRMIKSPIGKYNLLPSSNFIDVAINDGDEITALEYYKDRILQFKNKKVFVINTSGDYEFLEDTFNNIGVSKSCQVTKSPVGIIWANKQGCFLYDGKELKSLIDGKLGTESFQSSITNNYWITGDSPCIAYVEKTKKIIVTRDSSSTTITAHADGYIYDINSQGWSFTHKQFAANAQPTTTLSMSGDYTNFVKNNNGDILYFVNTAGTDSIMKWSDDSNVHTIANRDVFYFITKDYTMSGPSIRKKIYKVYVTFKTGTANTNIKVYHSTNGADGTFTEFSNSTSTNYGANGLTDSGATNKWITAELKPSSSINNVYSICLKFEAAGVTIPSTFQINDFSILYREKRPK